MKRLNLFKNKKILITGHTGFKGSWLAIWLSYLGGKILGISLEPQTIPSNYYDCQLSKNIKTEFINVQNKKKLEIIVKRFKPDFVFHLAAQSIVLKSFNEPINTWHTNLIGTMNLLESLKKLNKKCAVVLVTSDKCYKNNEWVYGYRETDQLGGFDPYSASKAAVINLTQTSACDLGAYGIRVNAVCPGLIDTEMVRSTIDEEDIASYSDSFPISRLGKPTEVANLVAFLASDRASYITGASLDINGGDLMI